MHVNNVHSRILTCSLLKAAELIDSFANEDSPLWPTKIWPRGKFDRPLQIGAIGSHGATYYVVEDYKPGERIHFRFIYPKGYQGIHGFEIIKINSKQISLKHFVDLHLQGIDALIWNISIRWVHDALIEDAFDSAEVFLTGKPLLQPNKWLIRVYFLRYYLGIGRLIINGLKNIFSRKRNCYGKI